MSVFPPPERTAASLRISSSEVQSTNREKAGVDGEGRLHDRTLRARTARTVADDVGDFASGKARDIEAHRRVLNARAENVRSGESW
jgi:hypothetical protein